MLKILYNIKYYFLKAYRKLLSFVFNIATIISPVLNTKLRYFYVFKKKINLKNPQTFIEKLSWLKLYKYQKDPLVIRCSDKYLVRDYVRDCGYADILNDLIGVWDSAQEIPWNDLPQKFALKWNFGATMNIICEDKSKLDFNEVVSKMNKWRKNKCWLSHSEMHYKYIPKKIICEKFLESSKEKIIPDYKVYCFNGEPKTIFVMHDRGNGPIKTEYFDTNWNRLENSVKFQSPENETAKPQCLERLLEISGKLSSPFPFVRCDFYIIGNKIYFGELTFTPAGGMYTSQTKIDGKDMSEFLSIF